MPTQYLAFFTVPRYHARVKLPGFLSLFSSTRMRIAAAVVLVALVGAGWIWWSRSGTSAQTLVVHRGRFLEQVSVSGKVVAAQSVDLGFAQSGRIAGVYAKAGDGVAAGTLLAQIENGDLRATVMQKEAALAQENAKLQSLKEGTRPESIAVSQASVASAQSALDQANQALSNAVADAYRAGDDAAHNKVDAFLNAPRSNSPSVVFPVNDQNLAGALSGDRVSAEAMLASWNKEVAAQDAGRDLSAAVEHARANLSTIAALLSDANAVLNHAITTAQYPQSSIDAYTASVAAARASVNVAAAALTSALSGQRAAQAALVSAQKSLALAQAPATPSDLSAQDAKARAAEADLAQARASLAKTQVVAPFSGVVTKMDAKTGEIVSPTVSEIGMESDGMFQIETYVPEGDIARVQVRQAASTTLDAYGESAVFPAVVVSVAPAETIKNGVSTYKVVLQFLAKDKRILPGMTANVTITTGDVQGVIAIPEGAITREGAYAYVKVKENGNFVRREVTTGDTSPSAQTEIISGLADGDEILLQ